MKLHVTHSLSPEELTRSLWAVAEAEGVAAPLEDLLKAETVRLPFEDYLRVLVLRLAGRHRVQRQAAARNVGAWLDRHAAPGTLAKARPGLHLTAEQIEELRRLIAAHWAPTVGGLGPATWTIPKAVWARWQLAGVVPATLEIPEIRDAFVAGRLYQVIEAGTGYDEMKRLAAQAPLGRPQRLALDFAEAQAAEHMTGFGARLGATAVRAAHRANTLVTRDVIAQYLAGVLHTTRRQEGPPHDLLPQERAALSTERAVETWRGLASELRKQFLHTDPDRDWLRLANTEVTLAHNAGRLLAYEEQGVTRLRAIVQPDACVSCKRLYLYPDGSPRIFTLGEVLQNFHQTGGLNMGRLASQIGDPDLGWLVTGGVIHPWCFVPGTRVEGSFVAGLEIPYSGPIVSILTSRGHQVTVTPNHPVLTARGWRPAAFVQEGEHVVSQIRGPHRTGGWAVEHDHRPPAIEQVTEALRLYGFRPVEPAREDLHGDGLGVNGQVYAVGPDRLLRLHLQSPMTQFEKQTVLVSAPVEETDSPSFSAVQQLLERGFTTTRPRPRGGALAFDEAPVQLEAFPFHPLRFGPTAESDLVLLEPARESGTSGAQFLGELVDRHASHVAVDRVVQVRYDHWSGHVYDLQSETGWLIANGIVMSNCRCKLIPVLEVRR